MKRLLLFLLLAFGIVGVVIGQRREVSPTVFYEATKSTREPLRFPIRSKTTEETFSSGVLVKTVVSEYEGTPSAASREIVREIVGGREITSVTIEHGENIYSKFGSEPWQKQKWYFRHPLSEVYSTHLDGYGFWRETRLVDSQSFTVFGSTFEFQRFQEDKRIREEEYYFVGERLIKKVQTDRAISPRSIIRRVTSTSEHDPKIKIEAPVQ